MYARGCSVVQGLGDHTNRRGVRERRTINNNARTRSSGRPALLSTADMRCRVSPAHALAWLDGTLQHYTGEYDGSHGLPREQGVVRVLQQQLRPVVCSIVRSITGVIFEGVPHPDGSSKRVAANGRGGQICLLQKRTRQFFNGQGAVG